MEQYSISKDVFWVEKRESLHVVKTDDPRVFNLEGAPADIFLAIAKKVKVVHLDKDLVHKVIAHLLILELIEAL